MKTLIFLLVGVTSLVTILIFSSNTDPFGLKMAFKQVGALNPSVAYAASPSIVDGYQPATSTLITWHGESNDDSVELTKGDKLSLCASNSEVIKNHPKYQKWCP